MRSFKIGINMTGAISAGAYTAGVLDFLFQALDEWYAAKARGESVPGHDVSIELLSGASTGGMCAAISALQLNMAFEHVHYPSQYDTSNRLYESWVNMINIGDLLSMTDLSSGRLLSLFNSAALDRIAGYALAPVNCQPRPYVSPNPTIFQTLTNLNGSLQVSPQPPRLPERHSPSVPCPVLNNYLHFDLDCFMLGHVQSGIPAFRLRRSEARTRTIGLKRELSTEDCTPL
jgi:hypothetical protein